MHVVDPGRFPVAATATYTPSHAHTVADMRAFHRTLGIENTVFVQPSIYGTDNSCLLEALRAVGASHGRGVVGLDPNTIETATLQEWHALGVRGARLNLVSVGREVDDAAALRAELEAYAAVLRPLDWVLQLFVPMKLAVPLETIVPDLRVKVCIDHFGWPPLPPALGSSSPVEKPALLDSTPGFAALLNLLVRGTNTWVKISAPYRLSRDPEMRDLDPFGRELIARASDRVVYATDWPHTRFENVDSVPFIEKCYDWCGHDSHALEKLFRTNAEDLWDARSD